MQVTDMALTSFVPEPLAETGRAFWTDAPSPRRFSIVRNAAIAFAVIALVEGVVIRQLIVRATNPPASGASVPLTIESPTSGDRVFVDGREVGVTPFKLSTPAAHSIRVIAREAPAAVTSAAAVAPPSDPRAAAAIAAAAQRQRPGGLRLTSSVELQVLEGERVL